MIPRDSFDSADVEVQAYLDAVHAFRDPHLLTVTDERVAHLRGGTVARIDGPDHLRRRRVLSGLVKRDGQIWFRDNVLIPALNRRLAAVLAVRDETGMSRVDMVEFIKIVILEFAAALVGLTDINSDARLADLLSILADMNKAAEIHYLREGHSQVIESANDAYDAFRLRFFEPAMAAHTALLEEVQLGQKPESAIPRNLMVLLSSKADPAWSDVHLAQREAMAIMNATIDTSVMALLHALADLTRWFDQNPHDWNLRTDSSFLLGAVSESLRLHALPAFYRDATSHVELPRGTNIHAGDRVAIRLGSASRDATAFGLDADVFNPRRVIPNGVASYGVAFGSGAHMCVGMPLILGAQGIDGSHVLMLKTLYEAGMERDPKRPVVMDSGTTLKKFVSFGVVFRTPNTLSA